MYYRLCKIDFFAIDIRRFLNYFSYTIGFSFRISNFFVTGIRYTAKYFSMLFNTLDLVNHLTFNKFNENLHGFFF